MRVPIPRPRCMVRSAPGGGCWCCWLPCALSSPGMRIPFFHQLITWPKVSVCASHYCTCKHRTQMLGLGWQPAEAKEQILLLEGVTEGDTSPRDSSLLQCPSSVEEEGLPTGHRNSEFCLVSSLTQLPEGLTLKGEVPGECSWGASATRGASPVV